MNECAEQLFSCSQQAFISLKHIVILSNEEENNHVLSDFSDGKLVENSYLREGDTVGALSISFFEGTQSVRLPISFPINPAPSQLGPTLTEKKAILEEILSFSKDPYKQGRQKHFYSHLHCEGIHYPNPLSGATVSDLSNSNSFI